MDYLATFHTQYGAVKFFRHCGKNGIPARQAPVPRELSASCGVCVRFSSRAPVIGGGEHEDLDKCYAVTKEGGYELICSEE